jgi:hypothetical protein
MTAKATPKAKAPKAEKAYSTKISTEYSKLIADTTSNNSSALGFIVWMSNQDASQAIQKESMSRLLKDVNVRPVVLPSHVPSLKIAGQIIATYETSNTKAGTILSLANRVLMDVHAEGATAHLAKFSTLEELNEGTKTKAESQADNAETKPEKETKKTTLESIFQKTITDIRKIGKPQELKTLDLETLATLYAIVQVIAKNNLPAKAKA